VDRIGGDQHFTDLLHWTTFDIANRVEAVRDTEVRQQIGYVGGDLPVTDSYVFGVALGYNIMEELT